MPHQCTNCGHTFPDGSKEMLSGCPDCGGNKFQFRPAGSNADSVADDAADATASSKADASTGESVTIDPETPSAGRQTSPPETEGVGDGEVAQNDGAESPAQSTARSDVVSSSELTAAGSMGPQSTTDEQSPTDQPAPADTPDDPTEESNLDELRKELNNQFESIRIVSPGQYELNLMELYDRDEYIISLREDGRYVIEVPDGWGDS
ncbi:MAG: Zn-ribbon containing protein [Euryarchaeota archaeon]|nr:Zn-ribbon containing protein [Euryarchaeota archaeon]